MKTIQTFGRTSALAAFLCATISGVAQAHVTFLDGEAAQESTILATLQVPHGCDGKATTEVQVKLPEGFVFAKPQPKAGWELEVIKGDYQKTYDNHGAKVNSGATEVRWKNGNLSDDFYDTFVIQGKVSGIDAGKTLAFPVKQICGAAVEDWDQIPAEGASAHGLKSPAPVLKIVAGGGHGHDDMAGMDMSGMAGMSVAPVGDAAKIGDLEISAGFAKAMLPGQPVGGGYFTVKNSGTADDRLVSVTSPASGKVALHEMTMKDNVMTMREVKGGILVEAGKTLSLDDADLHLMFEQVKVPFKKGDKVPVTLTFEKAGSVDLVLQVLSAQGK
jgi:uncharacterized protein YcnI/copper(I)-binding protein